MDACLGCGKNARKRVLAAGPESEREGVNRSGMSTLEGKGRKQVREGVGLSAISPSRVYRSEVM